MDFYVADKHFESFFDETGRVQEKATKSLEADEPVELNLDTLAAFLDGTIARFQPFGSLGDRRNS